MQLEEAEEEVGVKRRLGKLLPLPSVQVPSLLLLSSVNHIPYNMEYNPQMLSTYNTTWNI